MNAVLWLTKKLTHPVTHPVPVTAVSDSTKATQAVSVDQG